MLKSYLIASYKTGEERAQEPWLIPEDAFEMLEDCYVWRSRVRKRFGYHLVGENDLLSRFRINLGNTDGSGDISITVPGTIFKVGQQFSIGTEIFTVSVLGTPATMLDTGAATLATYNTTTGALVINGAASTTPVFFFPADPVMGLRIRESSNVNFEDIIGFDTQFAYRRLGGAWTRLGTGADATWTGTNSQFFWSINYRGKDPYQTFFYVVNFNRADHIRFIETGSTTWTDFRPTLGAGRFLDSCRLLIGYKDRLIALNTLETEGANERSFRSRCRFSQNGDPTNPAESWDDVTPGKGGFIDAPTEEQIVTADIIKDRLIVYFERSTWELVYIGFPDAPFRWQNLNNELGCESTFSVVGFDDGIFGVGNVGIHTCNGVNVSRIDQKIPDEIYQIHNGNDGPERVYGIRDFVPELVYWALPDHDENATFPTRVLVYNYKNATWAIFNDSITCFGYFQKDSDLTWETVGDEYPTWESWNAQWNSGRAQSAFPDVIAGNQEGFTFILNPDDSTNSQALSITNMTPASSSLLVVDHNLQIDDYVLIEESQGITSVNDTIFRVKEVTDADNVIIDGIFSGTYTGGGKLTRVSNINILTKQFNPGTPVGQQFRIPYIDFLLDRTANGEISVDTFVNANIGSSMRDNSPAGVILGSNTLFTKPEKPLGEEGSQSYIWHRFFLQTEAQFIQLKLFMTDEQMRDKEISGADFVMQAMMIYADPRGRITG